MLPSSSKTLTLEARKILMNAYKRAKLHDNELVRQNIIWEATDMVKKMCPNAFISDSEDEERRKAQAEYNQHQKNLEYALKLARHTTKSALEIANRADISLAEAQQLKANVEEYRKSKARRQIDAIFR